MDHITPDYMNDFEEIRLIIEQAMQDASLKVNESVIRLYWNIGKYVSRKAADAGWGRATVKELSQYILSKEPGVRGYSAQNIWRMKQFFETYENKPELFPLLAANTWSNNLHIMSKTKTDEEKVFYLKLASKEKYKARDTEYPEGIIFGKTYVTINGTDYPAEDVIDQAEDIGQDLGEQVLHHFYIFTLKGGKVPENVTDMELHFIAYRNDADWFEKENEIDFDFFVFRDQRGTERECDQCANGSDGNFAGWNENPV